MDIFSTRVFSERGLTVLALQVKSFSFSPDSGKIDCIQYDEIGLSWLLPALIGTWEIGKSVFGSPNNPAIHRSSEFLTDLFFSCLLQASHICMLSARISEGNHMDL